MTFMYFCLSALVLLLTINLHTCQTFVDEDPFIVNGEDAKDAEFPWQVSLAADGLYHFCGGSLIDKNWVITARHCVVDKNGAIVKDFEQWMFVVAGAHDVRRNSWSSDAQKILVKNIYIRPTKAEDIALLKLSKPADTLRADITAIKIADTDKSFIGYTCVTSGWGQYLENVQFTDIPRVLQKTTLTIYPLYVCEYFWDPDKIYKFDLCTANIASTPCMGDSGGPLVCHPRDSEDVLVGVTAWGSPDCAKNFPSIYKRVAFWRPWIRNVTGLKL